MIQSIAPNVFVDAGEAASLALLLRQHTPVIRPNGK
ncbi:MAG: hypothetical protein ACI9TI_000093 [Natronomonas sp.]